MQISLLIGLILVGNGFCQLFQANEISNEEDLMASAATLFGPKTFGIGHANLGNFGPLGYGGLGGMRIGSIGPLHYGHIGGIHADSFLGAPNPYAQEDESPGSIGTPTGVSQYQEIVGDPMEQNWQEMNDEENFIGMEPNEQEMWELGLQPQVAENSRAFLNDGLFGLNKGDKIEKIPPKPAPPPKFPKHPPPPPHIPPPPPHIPPPPPPHIPPTPPSYDYYGGYGSHGHDNSHGHSQGHSQGYNQGHSHEHSHGHSSPATYRGYGSHSHGSSHLHGHGSLHSNGYNKYGHSHGHLHGSSHLHGSHLHGSGSYNGGFGSLFRSNDEPQTMVPYGYESNDQLMVPYGYAANNQYQEFNQIKNDMPVFFCNIQTPVTTKNHQPDIVYTHQLPQSRQSARSSVDDILDGLDSVGFDFEFRPLIEDVFLTPYLGLLDPNDLDDDTLLLL